MIDNEIKDIIESFCDDDVTVMLDKYPLYSSNNINILIIDNKYKFNWHNVTSLNIDYNINNHNKDIALNLFKIEVEQYVKSAKRFFNKVIEYEKGKTKQN